MVKGLGYRAPDTTYVVHSNGEIEEIWIGRTGIRFTSVLQAVTDSAGVVRIKSFGTRSVGYADNFRGVTFERTLGPGTSNSIMLEVHYRFGRFEDAYFQHYDKNYGNLLRPW